MISYIGNYVWTPTSRLAIVVSNNEGKVTVRYADDTEEVIDDDELTTEHSTGVIAREFK